MGFVAPQSSRWCSYLLILLLAASLFVSFRRANKHSERQVASLSLAASGVLSTGSSSTEWQVLGGPTWHSPSEPRLRNQPRSSASADRGREPGTTCTTSTRPSRPRSPTRSSVLVLHRRFISVRARPRVDGCRGGRQRPYVPRRSCLFAEELPAARRPLALPNEFAPLQPMEDLTARTRRGDARRKDWRPSSGHHCATQACGLATWSRPVGLRGCRGLRRARRRRGGRPPGGPAGEQCWPRRRRRAGSLDTVGRASPSA